MQAIREPVQAELDAVNQLIIANLESDVDLVENIGHYIVDAGGKRLRPILALLSAACCGYRGEDHVKFAAVVEFIHTATLLHDDVVDISTLRRGRPTANAEFGNASSVLVGDFLYTRAFQLMVEIGNMTIMQEMANTTNMIAEGEVLQLVRAGDAGTTEQQYLEVITRKTAILFASACFGPAALCGREEELGQALHDYGMNTGIAFQIMDDVLDYEGDPETMGKNVGDDLREGKPTLPLLHVLREGNAAEQSLVSDAIRQRDASRLEEIVGIVQASGSLRYAREVAESYRQTAESALRLLPECPAKHAMSEIAELSINRAH